MNVLGPHKIIGSRQDEVLYLDDGEWLSWDDFGDLDPDEPQAAQLPLLEWEAGLKHRFPNSEPS